MPFAIGEANVDLVAEALSTMKVGVWEWEIEPDRMRVDSTCAALFGIPPAAAETDLPLRCATEAIHPDDFPLFRERITRVIEDGGLFVAEYRVCPQPSELKWVLARGRFEADATGAIVRGRGIVIDITESRRDGHLDGDSVFMSMAEQGELTPLHRATDAALTAYRELETMGIKGGRLHTAARTLLLELGRELAKSTPDNALSYAAKKKWN
jgi:hypothetical protein